MSYELLNLPASGSSMFGVVQWKFGHIGHEKKRESKTISCFYVKYSERSISFRLYCPSTQNMTETDNVKFIENI